MLRKKELILENSQKKTKNPQYCRKKERKKGRKESREKGRKEQR
jgi:hypothetical protein